MLRTSCECARKARFEFPVASGRLRRRNAREIFTSRTVMLAAHVVNHKSSEASATNNCQLQAKRTWNYRLRRSRPGTYPCSVSERLRIASDTRGFYARTLDLFPSRNSDARSVMLRIPLPEYADGTLRLSKGLTLRT